MFLSLLACGGNLPTTFEGKIYFSAFGRPLSSHHTYATFPSPPSPPALSIVLPSSSCTTTYSTRPRKVTAPWARLLLQAFPLRLPTLKLPWA